MRIRSYLRAIGLLSVLVAAGCLDPIPRDLISPPGPGNLTGMITDGCTGAPLAGAAVLAAGRYVTADTQGRYRLADVPSGEQAYSVAREGYVTLEGSIGISPEPDTTLDLWLLPNAVPNDGDSPPLLDVLFVVDASRSMLAEQQELTQNIGAFLEPIVAPANADIRVAVTRPDLGAGSYTFVQTCLNDYDGALQRKPRLPGCTPPEDPWVSLAGGQTNVPSGDSDPLLRAADAFSCIAQLGSDGCGFEQPLEAMRRALDPERDRNPGFLRPDAALAVIILTDEDDCSVARTELFDTKNHDFGPTNFRCFEYGVTCEGIDSSTARQPGSRQDCRPAGDWLVPVEDYVAFLRQLKPPAVPLFFATIAGPSEPVTVQAKEGVGPAGESGPDLAPSCVGGTNRHDRTAAWPAIRLKSMVDQLAPLSLFGNICADDLAPILRSLGEQIASATQQVCQPR